MVLIQAFGGGDASTPADGGNLVTLCLKTAAILLPCARAGTSFCLPSFAAHDTPLVDRRPHLTLVLLIALAAVEEGALEAVGLCSRQTFLQAVQHSRTAQWSI